MKKLTDKKRNYVNNLTKGMPQKEAYIKAGYKARGKAAEAHASRLYAQPDIQAELKKRRNGAAERAEVSKARVLDEYAKIAFLNPQDFYDDTGKLKEIHELDPDVAAAFGGMDVIRKYYKHGSYDIVKKIKFIDKKGALDSLARHLGLFNDKVNVGFEAEVISAILTGLPEELRESVIKRLKRLISLEID